MKGKSSLIWRVALALVLAASLGLVMALPAAANVSTPTVTVSPITANTIAQYTIAFNINSNLGIGHIITVTFPGGTTVPATYADGDVTVNGTNVAGGAVSGVGQGVTINLASAIAAPSTVTVVFKTAADIKNPDATSADNQLTVATTTEGNAVASAKYTIRKLPTVSNVEPALGNVGDTMWVEITGTDFLLGTTKDATFDFGAGVSVVSGSIKIITATEADVQITISAAGSQRDVTATTAAGPSTTTAGGDFTPKAQNTKQVDIWDAYNPTATTWTTGTLVFDKTQSTITAAVAAADATDILIAHAATYSTGETFPIDINKALTLKSYSGAGSTKITNSSGLVLKISAATVTVGGTGSGFAILGASGGLAYGASGIHLSTANAATIKGNTFRSVAAGESVGIAVEGAAQAGTTIDGNAFYGDAAWTTNTVEGGASTAILVGGGTTEGGTALTVSNNVAYYLKYTFLTFTDASLAGAVVVTGNDAHDNTKYGIHIRDIGDLAVSSSLKIYKNKLHGNGAGIFIESGVGSIGNITIQYNDIYGNTMVGWDAAHTYEQVGIYNEATTAVNAKYNWWGAIGGPAPASSASAARGNGDKVTAYVTYDPWLTEVYATVATDSAKRSYGSDAIALAKGWNTLSVPVALKGSANTFGEIQSLGTYLVSSGDSQNYLGGYWYDASTSTWVSIDSNTELTPGKGFYINMKSASTFPVLYFDGSLSLPSVSLPSGWNLVGAMFGIDKTAGGDGSDDYGVAATTVTDGQKAVNVALNSISSNASVVVSPSVSGNADADTWSVLAVETGKNMLVGKAYWVFMKSSATLAGFEVTPFFFTWSAP